MNKLTKYKMKSYGYLGGFLIQMSIVLFLCMIWLDPIPTVFINIGPSSELSSNQFSILLIGVGSSLFLLYKTYTKYSEYKRKAILEEQKNQKIQSRIIKNQDRKEVTIRDGN